MNSSVDKLFEQKLMEHLGAALAASPSQAVSAKAPAARERPIERAIGNQQPTFHTITVRRAVDKLLDCPCSAHEPGATAH